jgi:polysaccharide export outer membrane protein
VIASSWQPVQHLEPAVAGPEIGGGMPAVENPSRQPTEAAAPRPVPIQNVVDLTPPAPGTAIASSIAEDQPADRKADADDGNLPPPRPLVPTPLPAGALPMAMPPDPHGGLPLGPHGPHGPHGPPPVPREFAKQALPPYVVEPPDILLIEGSQAITDPLQPLAGQHLVRPDGTISLGINGTVPVAGLTIDQVRDAIASTLLAGPLRNVKELVGPDGKPIKGPDGKPVGRPTLESVKAELNVDVLAYNSKFYYIITDGGGYGAQVYRFPVTGNETVLDALAQIYGLPTVASKKKIWLARATPDDHLPPKVFPVDWCGLVKRGSSTTNYQVYPGDRIYVESDCLIRADTALSKFLSPILRGFGATLLGASTVSAVKAAGSANGGGTGGTGVVR